MEGDDQIPFGPPPPEEKLPLVVPDLTHERKSCAEISKRTGLPCTTPVVKGGDRCMGHSRLIDKAIRDEWRAKSAGKKKIRRNFFVSLKDAAPKTIPEVLLILSKRIDLLMKVHGEVPNLDVDEALCDLARTFVAVYKCGSDEAAAGIASHWTLKRRQA